MDILLLSMPPAYSTDHTAPVSKCPNRCGMCGVGYGPLGWWVERGRPGGGGPAGAPWRALPGSQVRFINAVQETKSETKVGFACETKVGFA